MATPEEKAQEFLRRKALQETPPPEPSGPPNPVEQAQHFMERSQKFQEQLGDDREQQRAIQLHNHGVPGDQAEFQSKQERMFEDYKKRMVKQSPLTQFFAPPTWPLALLPDIEKAVHALTTTEFISRDPSKPLLDASTWKKGLDVGFAALDLAWAGQLTNMARKAAAKRLPFFREKAAKIPPSPETVKKEAEAADAISDLGKKDPVEGKMDQLEFEYHRYHAADEAATKTALSQERLSRANLLTPKGATKAGESSAPYSTGYQQMHPAAMPEEGRNLFPGFTSEAPVAPEVLVKKQIDDAIAMAEATDKELIAAVDLSKEISEHADPGLLKILHRRLLSSTTTVLRKAGPIGNRIIHKIHNYLDVPDMKTAQSMANITPLLSKLSKAEYKNFVNVMDDAWYNNPANPEAFKLFEGITPMNDKVKAVVEATTKEIIKTTDEARNVGLDVAQVSRGFWSHTPTDMKKMELNLTKILKKNKQAVTDEDARALRSEWARKHANREYDGLEQARTLHVKGYDDLKAAGFETRAGVLENYFLRSNKRIEEIVQFGKDGNQNFWALNNALRVTHPKQAEIADTLFSRVTRRDILDRDGSKFAHKMVSAHVMLYMGNAAIMQLASLPNIVMRMGALNAMKATYSGMKNLILKNDPQFVERTGAILQNTIGDMRQMYSLGSMGEKYLKVAGVIKLDEITRRMAVHAGKYYLDDMIRGLRKNPESKYWNRAAKEIYLDPKTLGKGVKLTGDETNLAIKRLSDSTVGRTRDVELPLWLGHSNMKLVTLFKNYMIFQTKFMYNHVFKEIGHGNVKPLAGMLFAQYPVGAAVGDIRARMMGRERPEGWAGVIDNLSLVQAFGIFMELGLAAGHSAGRVSSWVQGPIISNGTKWVSALMDSGIKLAQGKTKLKDHKQLVKQGLTHSIKPIPFIGTRMYTETVENLFTDEKRKRIQRERKMRKGEFVR